VRTDLPAPEAPTKPSTSAAIKIEIEAVHHQFIAKADLRPRTRSTASRGSAAAAPVGMCLRVRLASSRSRMNAPSFEWPRRTSRTCHRRR